MHRELGLESRETFDLTYAAAVAAREAGQAERSVQLFGEAIELASSASAPMARCPRSPPVSASPTR